MQATAGGITPRSMPTLITISSMSARVFMNTPTHEASPAGIPPSRAARPQPPHLPSTATAITAAAQPQASGVLSEPMVVRRPV